MDDAATSPLTEEAAPAATPRLIRAGGRPAAVAIFALTAILVLAADLVLKEVAFATVAGEPIALTPEIATDPHFPLRYAHEPVVVVPGVLHLQLTTNTGAVFGLGKGFRWVFIVVSVAAVGIITWYFWRSPARAYAFHVALGLILAGALGNLYDRFMFSAVRDMLHLFPHADLPFGLAWPGGSTALYPWIFNLADVALVVGVLVVLVITWWHELRRRKRGTAPD